MITTLFSMLDDKNKTKNIAEVLDDESIELNSNFEIGFRVDFDYNC